MLVHLNSNYEDKPLSGRTVRCVYTLAQKLDLTNKALALKCSLSKACLHLGLPKSTLKKWIQKRSLIEKRVKELLVSKKTKWYHLNGKKIGAFGPIVEQELLEYYKEHRAENQVVTVGLLVAFWRRIDPENVEKLSAAACRLRIQ